VAIQEEASPGLSQKAREVYWLSLGEVSKLLELLSAHRVERVVLAGQVKHVQLFSSIKPDGLVRRVLGGLHRRNTDALIGAFVRMLEARGIQVVDSTLFLKPLLPEAGTLTRRAPDAAEQADIAYGRAIAKQIAGLDIGQTIVVADRACVAVEAMEGTDATIERAGRIMHSLEGDASTLSRALTVVKIAKPNQDMRFDVPTIGVKTIEVMRQAGATCLAVDAGKCLLLDGNAVIEAADRAQIAVASDPA
jgi:DUF1009 family protein